MQNYTYSKKPHIRFKKKRNKTLNLVLGTAGVLVFIALFLQLYVMSLYATKGEELAQYEAKKEALMLENRTLEQEIAQIRNIEYIKQKSASGGYVDINHKEVSYITVK